MKLIAIFLAVVVFAQPILGFQPVVAATVTYGSINTNALKGDVPCHKIGALLLAEGIALINGDDISIQGKEKVDSAVHELVSGKMVRRARSGTDNNPILNGYTYFNNGPLLLLLEPHCSGESVERQDGSKIVGRITDLNKDAVKILPINGSEQSIPMESVRAIHSPKVFKFSLRIFGADRSGEGLKGDARNIFFEPTCQPPLFAHLTRKRAIVYISVALLVATAIACSVAIPLSVHHHHSNSDQGLANLIIANKQPPTTAVPSIPIIRTGFNLPTQPPVIVFRGGRTKVFYPSTGILRKLPPITPQRPPPPRLLIPPNSNPPTSGPPGGPPGNP